MGINIGKLFKKIGLGALKSKVDSIADAIKDIKGKRKVDAETIASVIDTLDSLKTDLPNIKSPKALLESNRFKATIIGVLVTIAVHYGLPQEIAADIAEAVFYLISAYVLGDTLRPSEKPVDTK